MDSRAPAIGRSGEAAKTKGFDLPRELEQVAGSPRRVPRSIALGVFDGVHRGHQELLRRAASSHLRPAALTFSPHPRAIFGSAPPLLTSLKRRTELLRAHGAEDVIVFRFDHDAANTPAKRWAETALGALGVERVCVGEGFRFGRDRTGDPALLEALGFEVSVLPLVDDISSTRIRQLVASGNIAAAARDLGRHVELDIETVAERQGASGREVLARPASTHSLVPRPGAYAASLDDAVGRLLVSAGGSGGSSLRLCLSDETDPGLLPPRVLRLRRAQGRRRSADQRQRLHPVGRR